MVILDDEEYDEVWDIVYGRFNFNKKIARSLRLL